MKITRIRIGLLSTEKLRLQKRHDHLLGSDEAPPTPPDDENHYWAEAIEDGDKFYYRVKGTTVEITEDEFRNVVSNPSLYYFSTALKLHKRIERAKEGVPEDDRKFTTDSGWPSLRKERPMPLSDPPKREDFHSQEEFEEVRGYWQENVGRIKEELVKQAEQMGLRAQTQQQVLAGIDTLIETVDILMQHLSKADKDKSHEAITVMLMQGMYIFGPDSVVMQQCFPVMDRLQQLIVGSNFGVAHEQADLFKTQLQEVKQLTSSS